MPDLDEVSKFPVCVPAFGQLDDRATGAAPATDVRIECLVGSEQLGKV